VVGKKVSMVVGAEVAARRGCWLTASNSCITEYTVNIPCVVTYPIQANFESNHQSCANGARRPKNSVFLEPRHQAISVGVMKQLKSIEFITDWTPTRKRATVCMAINQQLKRHI